MSGVLVAVIADELQVLGVGHGAAAQCERGEVDAMTRLLVVEAELRARMPDAHETAFKAAEREGRRRA